MEIHQKKISPAFKGLTIETNVNGQKHHTFYSPGGKNLELEIVPLKKSVTKRGPNKGDFNGDYEPIGQSIRTGSNLSTNDFLKIWTPKAVTNPKAKELLEIKDPNIKIAYRFIDGKHPLLDEVRRININGQEYCLGWDPERPDLKKPRSIYHLMPDMIGPSVDKDGNPMPDRSTHTNVFGGKIRDIIDPRSDLPEINGNKSPTLLDYVKDMGFTRLLSTPIFNNGPKNSNGYWTKNPYQVDPIRGDIKDFKEMQTELFKRGMSHIADGAFVNESWEGIHVKDIIEHGEKSPFKDWFFIYNGKEPLNAPLLPDKENKEACKSVGIKIINGRQRLVYSNNNSNPIVDENPDYDPNLPTKIQLFDRRLATNKQQNSLEQIQTYDIKNLENPNETTSFEDAVQPVAFNVDPDKLNLKEGHAINPYKFALNEKEIWGKNLTLDHARGAVSNIEPWDGQNDILKLRFFVSQTEKDKLKYRTDINDRKKLYDLYNASAQVQDNLVQVGQFWTAETEKTLSEYTAKQLSEKLGNKPLNAQNFKNAIDELAKENKIPQEAKGLIKQEEIENLLAGKYEMQTAPLPVDIEDGLMSYPLEAIEFPDEICSVLASPFVKKLAFVKWTEPPRDKNAPDSMDKMDSTLIGVSRYDLKYRDKYRDYYKQTGDVYQKMDNVVYKKATDLVKNIINDDKNIDLKEKLIEDGMLSEQGRAIFRVVAGDVMKYIMIKALSGVDPQKDSLKQGKLEYTEKQIKNIQKKSLKNWYSQLREKNPETAAQSLVDVISSGITENLENNDDAKAQLGEFLKARIKGLDENSLKVAKLILNKTESGQEWRIDAARDVAKMGDVIREKQPRTSNTFAENWDEVIKVWSRFIKGVKEQNPKYYAIGESSMLPAVYPGDKHKGNCPTTGSVVYKFLEGSGFTTESNYTYLYNAIPEMAKGKDGVFDFLNKTLVQGWKADNDPSNQAPGYLKYGPVDSVLYSHVFTDNHDMKLSLHELSIDYDEFNGNVKPTQQRLKTWQGTKIGEKLEKLAEPESTKAQKLLGMKEKVFDKIYKGNDWWSKQTPQQQRDFISKNWDGGDGNWVEKDAEKAGIKSQYNQERSKLKAELSETNDVKKLYSAGIVTADAILAAYQKAAKEVGLPKQAEDTIKKALGNYAVGKGPKISLHWARRGVNNSWKDTVAEAQRIDKDVFKGVSKEKMQELADKVYENFTAKGRARIKAVELYQTIMPGSPTIFNITAETGMESEGKNESLQNRSRTHFEWINNSKHKKQFALDFKNNVKDTLSLRKRPELSPLVDGQMIMMKKIEDNGNLAALYRYNKKTDIVAILNTAKKADGYTVKPQTISSLDTARDGEFGVPGGLKENTVYINAFDKNDKYIVKKDGKLYSQRNPDGKITIDQPALILYREKPFNEN